VKNVVLIGAGAGSGKTYRLAEEVFEAVSTGRARPEGIILTTFTKKAASELRSRVNARLIASGQQDYARKMAGALIGTVHSICGQLLQDFAFDLGLALRQTILDEESSLSLFNRAIADAVSDSEQEALYRISVMLELEDWRDTIRALADLVRVNSIEPASLPKWAKVSVASLLEGFKEDPNGRETLRAEVECATVKLRQLIDSGADTTKKTKDAIDILQSAARELKKEKGIIWKDILKLTRLDPAKKAQDVVKLVKTLADQNYTWPEMRQEMLWVVSTIFAAVASTLSVYDRSKRDIGAIDFIDMERMLLDGLDHKTVCETLAGRIDLLMVDEFQDTSPIQMAIFLKLIALSKSVIWVGDPKQAIYGFRGTGPELMNAALRRIVDVGKTDRLEHSWRSRPELVDFVNNTFGEVFAPQGQERAEVSLKPKRKPELKTPATESWVLTKIPSETGRPKQDVGTDYAQIASEVIRTLEDKSRQVIDRETKKARPIEPGDIAILVRSNNTTAALAATFREFGIPVEVSVPGLLQEPEIVWVRAAIDLMLNPANALAAARLSWLSDVAVDGGTSPVDWLTDRITCYQSRNDDENMPWTDHSILAKIRAAASNARSLSPETLVSTAIEVSNAVQFAKRAEIPRLSMSNLDRLVHLARHYTQGEAAFGRAVTATGFMSWLTQLSEAGEDRIQPIAANAVQICTYHAAKGLEWPMVILYQLHKEYEAQPFDVRVTSPDTIDLQNPLAGRGVVYWPYMYGRLGKTGRADFSFLEMVREKSEYGMMARKRQEEETRLLYVAMTRARDYLVFAARPNALQALDVLDTQGGGSPLEVPQDAMECPKGWITRMPEIAKTPLSLPQGGDRRWITYKKRSKKDPGKVTPSQATSVDTQMIAVVGEPERYGERIRTGKIQDVRSLGNVLHAFLAVDCRSFDAKKKRAIASDLIASHGTKESVSAEDIVIASDAFYTWLEFRWPDSTLRREVPLHAFFEGVVVDGTADLLVETQAGIIIIDHKSFPGSTSQAKERVAKYAPQLTAYKRVIELATKKPVIETGIHMPVVGLYFPIIQKGA
jgi:ATP-dependent exoDNAse (exonuclease V) beta subunit